MSSKSFLTISSCLLVCVTGVLLSNGSGIFTHGMVYSNSGGGDPLPLPPNPPPPPPPPPGINLINNLI